MRFVEGGQLAEALAELNLTAARTALVKADTASDKRAQVWSAVNHLEGAVAALDSKLRGGRGKAQYVRPHNWALLGHKRAYALALMAICYRYLGEEHLAQEAVASGRGGADLALPEGMSLWAIAPILVTSLNPVDSVREELGQETYRVDWTEFNSLRAG